MKPTKEYWYAQGFGLLLMLGFGLVVLLNHEHHAALMFGVMLTLMSYNFLLITGLMTTGFIHLAGGPGKDKDIEERMGVSFVLGLIRFLYYGFCTIVGYFI